MYEIKHSAVNIKINYNFESSNKKCNNKSYMFQENKNYQYKIGINSKGMRICLQSSIHDLLINTIKFNSKGNKN